MRSHICVFVQDCVHSHTCSCTCMLTSMLVMVLFLSSSSVWWVLVNLSWNNMYENLATMSNVFEIWNACFKTTFSWTSCSENYVIKPHGKDIIICLKVVNDSLYLMGGCLKKMLVAGSTMTQSEHACNLRNMTAICGTITRLAHRCIIEISESGTSSFYPLQAKLIGSGTVSAQ